METWLHVVVLIAVALPMGLFLALAVPSWFGARFGERFVSGVVGLVFATSALASGTAACMQFVTGDDALVADLGKWFAIGHYHFEWRLVGDHLSLPFAWFVALLVGLIAAFSRRYLHRESGFFRFYLMLTLFGAGVELVVLAGSLDLVFIGWELVGLTSALLIAFFHERPKPVEHGLRAFITYRCCDVGMLAAVVWLHHSVGSTQFGGCGPWMAVPLPAEASDALLVGFLLLWASMGKSAQVPLGGWLPRAMEGPTPSSAIFYGAISVHLGPFLLLRSASVLHANPMVAWFAVAVGGLTALHGSLVGRVQTDIKSALAYASMTQVGLIVAEIGLGLYYIPLVHIVGHATIRSLEILRSPSLLDEHHDIAQAVGVEETQSSRDGNTAGRPDAVPGARGAWLYRYALERGYLDSFLRTYVVGGFLWFARLVDHCDQRLTRLVVGRTRDESGGNK